MSPREPHPIEVKSYEILRSRVDLSPMPPLWRAVVERMIHTSADLEYAVDVVTDEAQLRMGLAALRAGAPVVVDAELVGAAISERPVLCPAIDPAAARLAKAAGISRAAAAMRLAYSEVGPGAVWVVGCAPAALEEIIRRKVNPSLVIGMPAGFVAAAESKAALRASGLAQVSNLTEKGGPVVAAAALNALLYFEDRR